MLSNSEILMSQAAVVDQDVEPDMASHIVIFLKNILNTGLRKRLISLLKASLLCISEFCIYLFWMFLFSLKSLIVRFLFVSSIYLWVSIVGI